MQEKKYKISHIKKNILQFVEYKGVTKVEFCEKTGISYENMTGNGLKSELGGDKIHKILHIFPEIDANWLLTGEGSMFKSGEKNTTNITNVENRKNLIPLYNEVTSIGGVKERSANIDGVSKPDEYIDTGDWFRGATAAIRHYGDSMIEYPSGCILALKEVQNRQLIVWGEDYVIETYEHRITKRINRGKNNEYVRAYSSNIETYPDGALIHEPIDIAWSDIKKIFLVLGYVVKKNGGTMVYSSK